MVRFILVTFAFLAWLFYVMSGGADFDPNRARAEMSGNDPLKPSETSASRAAAVPTEADEVTRVSLNLTSLEDVLNGTDGTEQPRRLPQSDRDSTTTTGSLPQVETPEITPSLSESAASSLSQDRVLPSLIQDASPQTEVIEDRLALNGGGDIRVVTGSRVNVRGGPGTDYGVVATLVEGDRVEVLDDVGTGWVRLRTADGGTIGWMADFLLTQN